MYNKKQESLAVLEYLSQLLILRCTIISLRIIQLIHILYTSNFLWYIFYTQHIKRYTICNIADISCIIKVSVLDHWSWLQGNCTNNFCFTTEKKNQKKKTQKEQMISFQMIHYITVSKGGYWKWYFMVKVNILY